MEEIVGVDIGGSHISSLLIARGTNGYEVRSSLFSDKVANGASREVILSAWQQHLRATITRATGFSGRVAIAIPGPFNYANGIAVTHLGGKFASLVGVNIREALEGGVAGAMDGKKSRVGEARFANDAASFGLGVSAKIDPAGARSALAITLGTGVGSAFIRRGRLVTSGPGIPPGGEIYGQPFHDGTADDYFSTRWFVHRAEVERGLVVSGVKELLSAADPTTVTTIFSDFNANLHQLLRPLIDQFRPDDLLIGGNIARAWTHFAPELEAWLALHGVRLHQALNGEASACLGAAIACFPLTAKFARL